MALQNGSEFAYTALSQFWPSVKFTNQRKAINGSMSWVGYSIGVGAGANATAAPVVDRFRWEDGCIVEHVCGSSPAPSTYLGTLLHLGANLVFHSGTRERFSLATMVPYR